MSRVTAAAVLGGIYLLSSPVRSQAGPSLPAQPALAPHAVITFDSRDAGDVWRGDLVRYRFPIRNTGGAVLQLSAHPRCGCTVVTPAKSVAPGGEGAIEAAINTEALRGKVAKDIDLTTNDPAMTHAVLHMTANVLSIFQVRPGESGLLDVISEHPVAKEFELLMRDGAEVRSVACSAPYASARVEPIPGGEGTTRRGRLVVEVGPSAPVGRTLVTVTLLTSSTREPSVNVYVICEKGIVVAPATMHLGVVAASPSQSSSQAVVLTKRSGAFRVLSATSDDPSLQVSVLPVKEGNEYRIVAIYKGGWPVGAAAHRIVLRTDDPGQSTIEVPVTATVRSLGP